MRGQGCCHIGDLPESEKRKRSAEMEENMDEMIRSYIDELFSEGPKTRKAMDLKEEMAQNTIEKYQDLISEGYQQEDAYQRVIDSIGDVTELFRDLVERELFLLPEEERRKKAALKAVSVGLYIFAGVVFLLSMVVNEILFHMKPGIGMLGVALTVLVCIPPTCIQVYVTHMYPDLCKKEDILTQAYREAAGARKQDRGIRNSLSVVVWLLTVTIYFITSFATSRWEVTWIAFLVGACLQAILILIFSLKKE